MTNTVTKVFLVDDDEISLIMFKEALESAGLEVSTSSDVNTIDKIRSFKPDVIILDVVMPVHSGFDICTKLKQDAELQDIPTIMLTSEPSKSNRDKGKTMGIVGFLSKPIDKHTLVAAIQQQDAIHQVKKAWHNASSTLDNLLVKYGKTTQHQ